MIIKKENIQGLWPPFSLEQWTWNTWKDEERTIDTALSAPVA